MRKGLTIAWLLGAWLLTGCYQAHHHYDGPKVLTTGPGLGTDARVVGKFEEHDRQWYVLLGWLTVGEKSNGAEMAAEAVGEHDGAVNVRISDGQNLTDMLVSNILCIGGIMCGTWSTWAKGDIVDVVGPTEHVWIEAPEADARHLADAPDAEPEPGDPPAVGSFPAKQEPR